MNSNTTNQTATQKAALEVSSQPPAAGCALAGSGPVGESVATERRPRAATPNPAISSRSFQESLRGEVRPGNATLGEQLAGYHVDRGRGVGDRTARPADFQCGAGRGVEVHVVRVG